MARSSAKTEQCQRITVIGAGLMGHGIAQEFALAGHSVRLNDVDDERLQGAIENIHQNLEILGQSSEFEKIGRNLTPNRDLAGSVADADLVIEAITEDLEAKRRVFAQLDRVCPKHTILASNTSTFMPSQLAEATHRPERVLVAHYFNPPYLIPLVEIVGGQWTSAQTIETVRDLLIGIGKRPVVLKKEALGFIANRLQAALLRECCALVESGVASPQDVDAVVTGSVGRRLAVAGPFEILDAAGLDVWHEIAAQLMSDIESSQKVPETIARNVDQQRLGLKTGAGVHDWTSESISALRQRLTKALKEIRKWDGGRE